MLVAALKTDPVTLSAASTATITSAVTAAVAAEIAAITDITLDSSGDGTITDTLENLLNDGKRRYQQPSPMQEQKILM